MPKPMANRKDFYFDPITCTVKSRVKADVTIADADESDSDSLVRFTKQESAASSAVIGNDQVTRLAAAHTMAADAAKDAATSESADEAAEIVRNRVVPGLNAKMAPALQQSSQAVVPLPVAQEPTAAVYGAPGGKALSVRTNLDLMNRYLEQNLANEAASTGIVPAGQLGRIVAEKTACLIREVKTRGPGDMRLPRPDTHFPNPIETTFLREFIMVSGKFGAKLNPDTERQMRMAMEPSRRAHEEMMLRTPRANEMACAAADKCLGKKIQCPGGGAILMAYYKENEWAKYQDDLRANVSNARLPDLSRRCLLCIRYDAIRFVINLRAQNEAFRHVQNPSVVSTLYNLVGVEGEYRMEDCIVANGHVYEGLLLPIVKPSLFNFEQMIDKTSGCVFFRQILPYPGMKRPAQKVQSF